MKRRSVLLSLAMLAGSAIAPMAPAMAQDYPGRDIRFICAFPPGSGSDVLVRYFADRVRELAGTNIIVENRPGAAGNIAMEYVARSEADGYTIYVHAASSAAASMHLFTSPPVDVLNELRIAATINRQPYMVVVDANSPHQTLGDLTEALREKGDAGSYGAPNAIATVVAELYKSIESLDTMEIKYGVPTEMLNDLASGALDFGVTDPVFALTQANQGTIRLLGVTPRERMQAVPDLATLAEQGVDMDVVGWWAAMVPAATPPEIVASINEWFAEVVGSDETREFLAQFGGDPLVETPETAQARFAENVEEWREWVELAGIEPQ